MCIPKMALQIVRSRERAITLWHPTFVCCVHGLLMDSLFMALFMLLPFKSLLLPSGLIDAARIAASKFILRNDQITVHAGLSRRGLGL